MSKILANTLYRTSSERWAVDGVELTSGACFQVQIEGVWHDVVVEHDGRDYYAIPQAIHLYPGLTARLFDN